jgi:hypothetical protein
VIIGIPRQRLESVGFALKHQDVDVLDIEIMSSSTGDLIYEKLQSLSERIGIPQQIIADHGSDLRKGIRLFRQEYENVIYTYDITHKMASLLKHELEQDERFRGFMSRCGSTIKEVQQTELYFLIPPTQHKKSRYLNIDRSIDWVQNVLSYEQRGDFSHINARFMLDQKSLNCLTALIDSGCIARLSAIVSNEYPDESAFRSEVIRNIGVETWNRVGNTIVEMANQGRKRFVEKLGWIREYEEDIRTYSKMIELVHGVEKQVKHEGIHCESRNTFNEKTKEIQEENERLQSFKKEILEYLDEQSVAVPENTPLLGTSDILESIFGKYKHFSERNPLKEIGKMILSIPVFTGKLKDAQYVRKALETVSLHHVEAWAKRVFGQSHRSKRIEAFHPKVETPN